MRVRSCLRSLALFALVSCDGTSGGGAGAAKSPADLLATAATAQQSEDWKGVLAAADAVLADATATTEQKNEAWPLKVRADGQLNGDAAAKAAVEKMAAANVTLSVLDYFKLGNSLGDAGQIDAALTVIEKANDKYKDDKAAKKQLKRLAKRLQGLLQAAGNSEGVDKLKSLGYLGGGDDDEE